MSDLLDKLKSDIKSLDANRGFGSVSSILGNMVEVEGLPHKVAVGHRLLIYPHDSDKGILSEIIGFRENKALTMPYHSIEGVGLGCRAEIVAGKASIRPHGSWLGRVVDAFGNPIDDKGDLQMGHDEMPLRASPPPSTRRAMMGGKIDMGVRAINCFTTCCLGQRLGIFSGSGVGKSMLMSMMAKFSKADIIVIGLIGERGREVKEFIRRDLGEEGLKRSILVVATSDEPALCRREAAYTTLSICEYFRDKGKNVLCLMDSVTRFAMAQREIGLSAGEPPTSKGYTPTVFSELPRLLERAGPGIEDPITGKAGSITAVFTVLVEGDDHNEPISDAARGILDGHIVLSRAIAHRNRFPAIDILKSISRALPDCNTSDENALVNKARELLSSYEDMAELIKLGAYKKGASESVDEAIFYYDKLENFIAQDKNTPSSLNDTYGALAQIFLSDDEGDKG